MRPPLKLFISSALILFITIQAFSQNTSNLPKPLLKTWYAIKVGESEGGEMQPTTRKEALTFDSNGTMKIEAGNDVNMSAKWEYVQESETIRVTLSIRGNEQLIDLIIRDLSDTSLVLESPQDFKVTKYALTPPDLNAAKPRTAPLYVGSDSNIDFKSWSGLHPFNYKVTETAEGELLSEEAIGVLILLKIDGNNILRLNENGLTTDIKTSQGQEIKGEMHFNLITQNPELSGKIVFRSDNTSYILFEKDKSKVEYIKK
ncbi:MAG: hypothetical protein V2I62_08960 [Bacteroidales bacterium]|jgi:hypothetical protein|nr:hypothetical protein [Bacteroidales bacterium]